MWRRSGELLFLCVLACDCSIGEVAAFKRLTWVGSGAGFSGMLTVG